MKRFFISGVILLGLGTMGWWYLKKPGAVQHYRLAKVEKGTLVVTTNATGTIQPITLVQVGTQVTGTIRKLFADFNSQVKAGEIVAQIDPALFQSRVAQDQASVLQAQANVEKVQADLVQAQKELVRSQELAKRNLLSPSDLDAAVATEASLQAQLKLAHAAVTQAQATLEMSNVNLQYTTIRSPVDGIVITRNVDVGQTVASSLQAPTLFVVAGDLKSVQVQASVPEADIGKIFVGQPVFFTVDAYDQDTFTGKVSQIRLSPTTVQNVVTYTVIVDARNPEGKLLPGMTANITFVVARHTDILEIPNAALRFRPFPEVQPRADQTGGNLPHRGSEVSLDSSLPEKRGTKSGGSTRRRSPQKKMLHGQIWVLDPQGQPKSMDIEIGDSDGTNTQLVKGDLNADQEVIVGILSEKGKADEMSNPFATSSFHRGGGHP